MKVTLFKKKRDLVEQAAIALAQELQRKAGPRLVVLPGGRTPAPVYESIIIRKPVVDENVVLALSDERIAPGQAHLLNSSLLEPLVRALGIPDSRWIRPSETDIPEVSAARFGRAIGSLFEKGGILSLAMLGLGSDGHTAGLYYRDIASVEDGVFAVSVKRPDGIWGVTLTKTAFKRAERVVFVAHGPAKQEVIRRVHEMPASVPGMLAVEGARQVEIWYAPNDD